MACCQGDMGQPGSVSFADANETSQLCKAHAKPSPETQTEQPLLPWEQPLHAPGLEGKKGCTAIYLLFTFACDVSPLCPVCPMGKEGLLLVSLCPKPPSYWHLSLLVSSPISLILWVELAFSVRGMESSVHCWITARHSTPPRRQQKGRLLCLAGGKQLGTDDAGRVIYVATATAVTRFCCERKKQRRGGAAGRSKMQRAV